MAQRPPPGDEPPPGKEGEEQQVTQRVDDGEDSFHHGELRIGGVGNDEKGPAQDTRPQCDDGGVDQTGQVARSAESAHEQHERGSDQCVATDVERIRHRGERADVQDMFEQIEQQIAHEEGELTGTNEQPGAAHGRPWRASSCCKDDQQARGQRQNVEPPWPHGRRDERVRPHSSHRGQREPLS